MEDAEHSPAEVNDDWRCSRAFRAVPQNVKAEDEERKGGRTIVKRKAENCSAWLPQHLEANRPVWLLPLWAGSCQGAFDRSHYSSGETHSVSQRVGRLLVSYYYRGATNPQGSHATTPMAMSPGGVSRWGPHFLRAGKEFAGADFFVEKIRR